ncbi:MAG: LLM class flavin-dependent oxidoreductase [Acidobacteria bacterium]|nr:LLM class flavin-dependent oxidoreductase [Acidobacteriota bacterium]
MAVTFDIGILPSEPVGDTIELVRQAESLGYGAVWMADSQSIFRDAYVALAAAAVQTSRILLATGVSNPVTRHPASIACSIASIDELSGGRAILGIGTGFSAVRTVGMKPATLRAMEDATTCLRALIEGREGSYGGVPMKMPWSARNVPIYFACSGPKSLYLAGRIADGVVFQVGADPALIQHAIEQVHAGARDAGRNPAAVGLCARLGCAVSDDRQQARDEIRPYAAAAAETVFQSNSANFLAPELASDLRRLKERYDYYQHVNNEAQHRDLVTDRIIDAMVVAGTPDDVLPALQAIISLGVDRIVIPLTVKDRRRMMMMLAEEVIARLQ